MYIGTAVIFTHYTCTHVHKDRRRLKKKSYSCKVSFLLQRPKAAADFVSKATEGSVYCAKYSDQQWYRVKVKRILPAKKVFILSTCVVCTCTCTHVNIVHMYNIQCTYMYMYCMLCLTVFPSLVSLPPYLPPPSPLSHPPSLLLPSPFPPPGVGRICGLWK